MEIRQANGEFEEHIKTQTTCREFVDLVETVGLQRQYLLQLGKVRRTHKENNNIEANKSHTYLPINSYDSE